MHCDILIQHKSAKCTFVKSLFSFSFCLLLVSNPRVHFHEEGCTYRYGIICLHKVNRHGVNLCTACKYIIVYLYVQPSSWRWALGFETCKGKVKCTPVQALRLCTGRTVHRGSKGIALLYRHWGSVQAVRPIGGVQLYLYSFLTMQLEGMRCQCHALAALYPRERPGTHCTGDWVGPRAGLDRWRKSRPHRDSIPGLSSP